MQPFESKLRVSRLRVPRLRALNGVAPIATVIAGRASADEVLPRTLPDLESRVRRWLRFEPPHDARPDPNAHGEHVRALCLTHDAPLDWLRLQAWLAGLRREYGDRLLREGGPRRGEERDQAEPRREPPQRERRAAGRRAHRHPHARLRYFFGSDAGLPKSTFGALEISRSFSTANCGFSL